MSIEVITMASKLRTGCRSRKPEVAIGPARNTVAVMMPDIKNSPCAKLIMNSTPYTKVYPIAIKAYMLPWASPKTTKSVHWREE
jgi:hypothetical protein